MNNANLQTTSWEAHIFLIIAALALGYLLGSIPFGLLLTKMAGLGDVRSIGSGNIGATNVLRTGNKKLAAGTLICDMLKGTVAVLLASYYGADAALAAGLGAFIGHTFPVWLGFKGGKGVATYLGVLIALAWQVALIFAGVWLLIAVLTRYSSLSALVACIIAPIALYLQGNNHTALLMAVLTILIFIKHHTNITRLMDGSESKIGAKK
ncbi:glycerol-3-phosphate acyltransferase PlsY [Paenochrobactrum gallinarii]|uniref:Glycerol-3-phosphate acyltransferase n=1 Tax=Paenochrobactrum gallinarii TaxID=643673 RepID=A0A841M7Y5_9HYPH|nr:glycerol-3-phosphate 1-O-acyltransferase PlsY [Paenochrobactrum gallinarii]MBB6261654.1 glycerol-3-phosphate acyltransferase PlsY [Paenochrobactrum gallinarii]